MNNSQSLFIQQFLVVLPMELSRDAVGGLGRWDNPTVFGQEGSKCWYVLQLGKSTLSEVRCARMDEIWWLVSCLVRCVFHSRLLVGSLVVSSQWYPMSQPGNLVEKPPGAHRPTGRVRPAGCGSARQPKPSVTIGGANSWCKKMVVRAEENQPKNTPPGF